MKPEQQSAEDQSIVIAESERLRLSQLTEADASVYLKIISDPDFKRFIGDRGAKTEADALSLMKEKVFRSYAELGFGMYLVSRRNDGTPLGIAGLVKRDFLEDIDVGYAFLPEARGMGYATEAANACIALASDTFKRSRLAAITDPENTASIRVLLRIGFTPAGEIIFPDDNSRCAHFLLDLSA